MSVLCLCNEMPKQLLSLTTEKAGSKELCQNQDVVSRARNHLEQHTLFRSHTLTIDVGYQEDRLVLTGCVPSFYLKQLLQTVLRDVPGVARIDNRVDVVSSCGLSSIPRSHPRIRKDEQHD